MEFMLCTTTTATRVRSLFVDHARALAVSIMAISSLHLAGLAWGQSFGACGSNICSSTGAAVGVGTTSPAGRLDVEGGYVQVGDRGDSYGSMFRMTSGNPTWDVYAEQGSGKFLLYQYRNATGAIVGTTRFAVDNSGNVGIGTVSPAGRLDVEGGYVQVGDRGDSWGSMLRMMSGHPAWDMYVEQGSGKFRLYQYINAAGTVVGADRFVVDNSGNVGIGTSSPQSLLAVNGTITTKEVIVTNTGWSDYVFVPSYRLKPLTEVASFIKEHHHLPEIPSEAEVKEKGVSLGDMQAKLLGKIEEITLHMIHADERNTRLEQQNRELRERITRLETRGVQRNQ